MGRQGGKQDISIGNGCERLGTVIHEMMHTIGFIHEQSRPDRDEYVEVFYDNIKAGEKRRVVFTALFSNERTLNFRFNPLSPDLKLHTLLTVLISYGTRKRNCLNIKTSHVW